MEYLQQEKNLALHGCFVSDNLCELVTRSEESSCQLLAGDFPAIEFAEIVANQGNRVVLVSLDFEKSLSKADHSLFFLYKK